MSAPTPFASKIHHHFLRLSEHQVIVSNNERQILDLIRRNSVESRADLVQATGLSAQSIMRLVDELVTRGFLKFGAAAIPKGRGKPSLAVTLVPEFAYSFGISIYTDAIAFALIDFSGAVIAQRYVAISPITQESLVENVKKQLASMIKDSNLDPAKLFGVGVGMTGYFVGQGSKLNPPALLDDLALVELDQLLARELGYPVWLDNDGNVAAIGESLLGVGKWAENFAYLYFSHGFGGGIVLNNQCFRGAHGNAGEFASMLAMQGLERPTLESLRVMLVNDGLNIPDIASMISVFDPTWPAIERWITMITPGLSRVVSATLAIFDPDAIVLGGRIPAALAQRLIPHIQMDDISRRGHQRPQSSIVLAEAPSDTTAIGAAALPFKEHFFL